MFLGSKGSEKVENQFFLLMEKVSFFISPESTSFYFPHLEQQKTHQNMTQKKNLSLSATKKRFLRLFEAMREEAK